MVRWPEFFRPTPRVDEQECERVRTMSRAAARVTWWATAMVLAGVLAVSLGSCSSPNSGADGGLAVWRLGGWRWDKGRWAFT